MWITMSTKRASSRTRSISQRRASTPKRSQTPNRQTKQPLKKTTTPASNGGFKVGDVTNIQCFTCKAKKKCTIEKFVHKTITGKRKMNFAKGTCNTCGGKVSLIISNTKK